MGRINYCDESNYRVKQFLYILVVLMIMLVACEEEPTPTPTDTPAGPATGVALNPPRVWIDRPLSGQIVVVGSSSSQIISHAAALGGNAQLEVRDDSNQVLASMDLGAAVDSTDIGGLMNRYEGDWQAVILPLLENAGGPVVLTFTVVVDGVPSNPVTVTFALATATPTSTSTPTITPSATPTATAPPATATVTPTETNTATPSPTFTPTASATSSPTDAPTPTDIPTGAPTETATPIPTVVYVDKGTLEPCTIVPSRGLRVEAQLAPGRDTVVFIESPNRYTVTGKITRFNQLWWQILLPQTQNSVFVRANQVLTAGSCAIVGTVVPPSEAVPTRASTQQATEPVVEGQPTIIFFRTTSSVVTSNTCATLSWSVVNVDAVYLNGAGVVGNASRGVCATEFGYGDIRSLNYTLSITKNGATVDSRTITLRYDEEEPTVPPTVPPTAVPSIVFFNTSSPNVNDASCATLSWNVVNADATYLNGESVPDNGSRTVCAADFGYGDIETMSYTLSITKNGATVDSRTITLVYVPGGIDAFGNGALPWTAAQ